MNIDYTLAIAPVHGGWIVELTIPDGDDIVTSYHVFQSIETVAKFVEQELKPWEVMADVHEEVERSMSKNKKAG